MERAEAPAILLVEDNPHDLELMHRALARHHFEGSLRVARDGAEALEILFPAGAREGHWNGHRPRVILLDLKLPKVSGFDVLRRLKADDELRVVPVVVLSSSREERDVIESYRLGANSYVVKPVDYDRFCQIVAELSLYWSQLNESPR